MTDTPRAEPMKEWLTLDKSEPAIDQPIWAEIYDGGEVAGKYGGDGVVLFDFWSGTAAERIVRWRTRTPSGGPGHPWTSIDRGAPAEVEASRLPLAGAATSDTAWLVEYSGKMLMALGVDVGEAIQYLAVRDKGYGAGELMLHADPNRALRFARKQDAEAALTVYANASDGSAAWIGNYLSAQEHMWPGASPAPADAAVQPVALEDINMLALSSEALDEASNAHDADGNNSAAEHCRARAFELRQFASRLYTSPLPTAPGEKK